MTEGPPNEQVTLLPLDKIKLNPEFQPRDKLDPQWVATLAAVMAESPDAVPPILCYRLTSGIYRLTMGQVVYAVGGFHRLAAAKQLGWTEIRAIVREGTEAEALDAAAQENAGALQKPLTYTERRRLVVAMARRHPEWGIQEEIARRMHMTPAAVSYILAAEEVKAALAPLLNVQELSDRVARAIGKAPPEHWPALAEAALAHRWSASRTAQAVEDLERGEPLPQPAAPPPEEAPTTRPTSARHLSVVVPASTSAASEAPAPPATEAPTPPSSTVPPHAVGGAQAAPEAPETAASPTEAPAALTAQEQPVAAAPAAAESATAPALPEPSPALPGGEGRHVDPSSAPPAPPPARPVPETRAPAAAAEPAAPQRPAQPTTGEPEPAEDDAIAYALQSLRLGRSVDAVAERLGRTPDRAAVLAAVEQVIAWFQQVADRLRGAPAPGAAAAPSPDEAATPVPAAPDAGYKTGVRYHSNRGKWLASARLGSGKGAKTTYLGYWVEREDAERACAQWQPPVPPPAPEAPAVPTQPTPQSTPQPAPGEEEDERRAHNIRTPKPFASGIDLSGVALKPYDSIDLSTPSPDIVHLSASDGALREQLLRNMGFTQARPERVPGEEDQPDE